MSKAKDHGKAIVRDAANGRFVVDGKYLRTQASEALETFLAPVSGVYSAWAGSRVKRKTRSKRAA